MLLSPSLALLISIAGILILLRLRVHPGFAIFAGSLILAGLVLPLTSIPAIIYQALFNYQTARLLVIVASALTLSRLMEGKGLLAELATAMESINPKLALHFIPAVIGFVPVPAGALISATASRDLTNRVGLTPEQGTFINYWFRHIWEFSIPVYQAIVLTSVILSIPISLVVVTLFPLTAISVASGAVISYWILRKIPKISGRPAKNIIYKLLRASWPILILVPSVLLGLEAMIAFPVTVALLAIQQRVKWPELKPALKYGLDLRILFLLCAVMLYKTIIESSGAAEAVFSDMQSMGLSALIMLIVLPLLMGLATGFTIAFAGVAIPLLVPFITSATGIHGYALFVAYASGLMGIMLSPLHLCLVLSAEYFKANMARVYRYLLPAAVMVEGIAILVYFIAR